MPSYCTPEDMAGRIPKRELIQLVSIDTAATWESVSVQAELARIIGQAQDKVDAALGAVVGLPLAAVTAQVKTLTLDLACCYAYLRRPPLQEGWGAVLQSAEATLRGIARGDIPVQVPASEAQTPPVDNRMIVESESPRWGSGFWGGFRGGAE